MHCFPLQLWFFRILQCPGDNLQERCSRGSNWVSVLRNWKFHNPAWSEGVGPSSQMYLEARTKSYGKKWWETRAKSKADISELNSLPLCTSFQILAQNNAAPAGTALPWILLRGDCHPDGQHSIRSFSSNAWWFISKIGLSPSPPTSLRPEWTAPSWQNVESLRRVLGTSSWPTQTVGPGAQKKCLNSNGFLGSACIDQRTYTRFLLKHYLRTSKHKLRVLFHETDHGHPASTAFANGFFKRPQPSYRIKRINTMDESSLQKSYFPWTLSEVVFFTLSLWLRFAPILSPRLL